MIPSPTCQLIHVIKLYKNANICSSLSPILPHPRTRTLSLPPWQISASLKPTGISTLRSRPFLLAGPSPRFPRISMVQTRSHSTKPASDMKTGAIKDHKPANGKTESHRHDQHEHDHAHDHDHEHTHSHSIFGHSHSHGEEHSHDAEQIIAALKGSGAFFVNLPLISSEARFDPGDRGSYITLVGLASNVVLTATKALAGWFLHSASLLADAGHSLSGE